MKIPVRVLKGDEAKFWRGMMFFIGDVALSKRREKFDGIIKINKNFNAVAYVSDIDKVTDYAKDGLSGMY